MYKINEGEGTLKENWDKSNQLAAIYLTCAVTTQVDDLSLASE